MQEKRRFERVSFVSQTYLETSGRHYEGVLKNISLKGALVCFEGEVPVKEGDRCLLNMQLTDSEVVLSFNATAVRIGETEAGFRFETTDIDTVTHLRRLLELNLGTDMYSQRELAFLDK